MSTTAPPPLSSDPTTTTPSPVATSPAAASSSDPITTTTPPSTTSSTSTTSTTTSPNPTNTSQAPSNSSTPTIATTNPGTSSSNSNTPGTSSTNSTSVPTTLSVATTSVGQSTAIATSDGQTFATIIQFTTVIPSGSVVTALPVSTSGSGSNTNIGAIVGGAVGGAAALIILILVLFCLRKRRKDEFDGNFDPAHVTSVKGGGGGTLPKIDLGEGDMLGSGGSGGGGVRAEGVEDDGMGGRLGTGAGGGGIIVPYAFKPSVPVGGFVGQEYQNQQYPQMQQMANVSAAASSTSGPSTYGNDKQPMRQYSQQTYATAPQAHTPNHSISSGSYYPTTLASSTTNLNPHMNQNVNPNGITPEPHTPGGFSITSDGSSSGVGGGGYFQNQGIGSPGPSGMSSSSGGRNAKAAEAMGRVVMNPDGNAQQGQGQQGQYTPQQGQPGQPYAQFPAFQAYLQNGPGPHQQQYNPSSSSAQPFQNPQAQQSAGTAVVVHEDGGRVVLRKGEEGEGEGDALNPEIPPTYDSLPVDVRRDG